MQADWANDETAKGLQEIYDAHNLAWAFLSLIQKSHAAEMGKS